MKPKSQRETVLAFPTLYPREVLTALGLRAWERWSEPPGDPFLPDAGKLQGYLCPTVRGAQAVLARKDHNARVAIIPHTCDSMQGLASIANANPSWDLTIVPFRHPRGSNRPASRLFLHNEVTTFIATLEDVFQRTIEPEKLVEAIELHRKLESLLARVLQNLPRLFIPAEQLYQDLRKVESLHPEDMIELLQSLLPAIHPEKTKQGVGLLLSGMVPEPPGLFDTLENAGAYVAADDYASLGRRLPAYDGPIGPNPIDTIVERLMLMPPCPTRCSDASLRIDHIRSLVRSSGARGVILHTVKFCEPELFDVATLRRALEPDGIGVLHLETEFEEEITGQMATRLEAFCEMLHDGGNQ